MKLSLCTSSSRQDTNLFTRAKFWEEGVRRGGGRGRGRGGRWRTRQGGGRGGEGGRVGVGDRLRPTGRRPGVRGR